MALADDWQMLRQAARQWSDDHASEMGAALAYFTLFSIAPLLLIAIAIAGLIFGPEAARGAVEAQLKGTMGEQAAHGIQQILKRIDRPIAGLWTTIGGTAVLLLGALGAFVNLRSALTRIWRLEPPGGGGFLATLLNYLLAAILVLCCGVLLIISLAANTALTFLTNRYESRIPGGHGLWQTVVFLASFGFLTLLFAVVFRVMSARRIPWRLIWYGAAVTSLLFTVGKTLIGYYLAFIGAGSAYGAAGSVVVLLIWIYYSAQIVFFGAELVQVRRMQEGR